MEAGIGQLHEAGIGQLHEAGIGQLHEAGIEPSLIIYVGLANTFAISVLWLIKSKRSRDLVLLGNDMEPDLADHNPNQSENGK